MPDVPRDGSIAIDILFDLDLNASLLAWDAFALLEAPGEHEHLAFAAEAGSDKGQYPVGGHKPAEERYQRVAARNYPAHAPERVDAVSYTHLTLPTIYS